MIDQIPMSLESEQSVLGALLTDSDALDRIADLKTEHFYRHDHRLIFTEICMQSAAGKRVDVVTVFEALRGKIEDGLVYMNQLVQSSYSSANIVRHAGVITDRALKRSLISLGREMEEIASGHLDAEILVDQVAAKVEALARKQTQKEPRRLSDTLGNFVQAMEDRMAGKVKPIPTGYADLDSKLGGGLDRGTVTVVAGRPAMGKTAFGLGIARSVGVWGSSLILSMEMSEEQLNDRNIAALGKIPLGWIRQPADRSPDDKHYWAAMTHAFAQANDLNLYIDDQTALNMLAIRNKARKVKRKHGLDALIIDQLSFITGALSDKSWEAAGEYTRGLLQVAKELNIAVVLMCQLNRECEKRPDKRPVMADLAVSGSIEQDASTIIFLYRDEVYSPDSIDKGVCEVITRKQRQGEIGTVGLAFVGAQTRFEDMAFGYRLTQKPAQKRRGLAEAL